MTRQSRFCFALFAVSSAIQLSFDRFGFKLGAESPEPANATQGVSELYSWSARPWGACILRSEQPVRFRDVDCVNILTGDQASSFRCDPVAEPCRFTACRCGPSAGPCVNAAVEDPTCLDSGQTSLLEALDPPSPQFVGCLKNRPRFALGPERTGYETSCMACQGTDLCNGGLPFFRKVLRGGGSNKSCSKFCFTMGMDISSFDSDAGQCFCGATRANTAVFHIDHVRPCLAFGQEALLPQETEHCAMSVYRWGGVYTAGAISPEIVETKAQDTDYINSMILGRLVDEDSADYALDQQMPLASISRHNLLQGSQAGHEPGWEPWWHRNCYPSNCGPGRGPWPKNFDTPVDGVEDRYEGYARIRYVFDSNIDDGRKQGFRAAVDRWHAATCINLLEVDTLDDRTTYELKVVNYHTGCTADPVGVSTPGGWTFSRINLGWCNTIADVGSMIHEIGHIVGMMHEQQRPDALSSYFGKGPYIAVNWDRLSSEWVIWWQPDPNAYVGSADDGTGDPYSGYAPYDFGSVMHYPLYGSLGETFPAWNRQLIGNRRELSWGDVRQISDMYQCVPRVSTTTTTTPWYMHFAITEDWLWLQHRTGSDPSFELDSTMTCIQSAGYPAQYGIRKAGAFTVAGPDATVTVNVIDFDTEVGRDVLYVHGSAYSGTNGPSNAVLAPGDLLYWTADSIESMTGWKMCLPEPGPRPPTVAPTPLPTASPTVPPTPLPTVCDTDFGATDPYGDGCDTYARITRWCGRFDDSDFSSMDMCCACGGGPAPPTPVPTDSPTVSPTPEPTMPPTTEPPTESPTVSPTPEPTVSLTESPTVSPTPAPPVAPATPEPTLAGKCGSGCSGNTNDWSVKCNWKHCGGCADCVKPCEDVCETITKPWTTKCGFKRCKGCSICPQGKCKNKCRTTNTQEWKKKCKFTGCSGCIECMGVDDE